MCDRRAGRLTAVLVVEGAQFACQDTGAQDALLASWGDVLGGTAATGSPVVQIGWSDAATMSGLAEHRRWADDRLAEVDGTIGDPASYQDLLAEMTGLATAHETVVWITVAGAQVRDGHGKPLERAAAHLPAAVDNLTAALTAAGLHTAGPLPAVGLWRLLRARIDPDDEIARPNPGGRVPGRAARSGGRHQRRPGGDLDRVVPDPDRRQLPPHLLDRVLAPPPGGRRLAGGVPRRRASPAP